MRAIIYATAISVLAAVPGRAEERTALPDIVVGAPPARGPAVGPGGSQGVASHGELGSTACDGAAGGSERSFRCLNQKWRQEVDRVNPPVTNKPPIDANSSDLKVGTVNIPGVQQQYGRNFGVSVYPYRPPPPVYVSPFGRR